MEEIITRKVFDDGIAELLIVFSGLEMTAAKADLWYKYSKQLSDSEWENKIKSCIRRCRKAAPVIADILDETGSYVDEYFRA